MIFLKYSYWEVALMEQKEHPGSVTSSTTYLLVTLGKNLIFEGQCSLISVNKKKWISEIPNKS